MANNRASKPNDVRLKPMLLRAMRIGKVSNHVLGKLDKFVGLAQLNVGLLDHSVGVVNNAFMHHTFWWIHHDIQTFAGVTTTTKLLFEIAAGLYRLLRSRDLNIDVNGSMVAILVANWLVCSLYSQV